jgi:ATP-dependent RNA helicase DeaD
VSTFSDLPLHPKIQESLARLGITTPTEIQALVLPLLLENPKQDMQAQAQTGTGKTFAFGLPLLHAVDLSKKVVQGLVVAPTRELVLQIYENLKEVSQHTGIVLEPVYGGMPIERQITRIKAGPHIIIGTPGRLNDHLRRKTLSLAHLTTLVLDEADIMLEMGFKEEIDEILHFAPKSRQIWLFSATIMGGIKQLIKTHMKNVVTVRTTAHQVITSQVEQYFCLVPTRKRVEAAARFIEATPDFYGIIFCQTKTLTSEVTEQLASKGFKVNCLHGDMKQTVRNNVIRGFKNRDFSVLVATNVAARGIDVSELTHVINFSIPEEHESYIHRIGRTGRAGKQGIAIVFVAPEQQYKIKQLERTTQIQLREISIPPIEAIINIKMGAVSDFIEQTKKPDKKLSPAHQAIKELIESFSQEEIKNALAITLAEKFFKDISRENISVQLSSTEHRGGQQEISLSFGRFVGLNEKTVREYLHEVCKLEPHEIRKVRVLDNRTFIAIPEDKLPACVNTMRSTPITKHKARIEIVEDIRHERSEHGPRKRMRRFDRKRRR